MQRQQNNAAQTFSTEDRKFCLSRRRRTRSFPFCIVNLGHYFFTCFLFLQTRASNACAKAAEVEPGKENGNAAVVSGTMLYCPSESARISKRLQAVTGF